MAGRLRGYVCLVTGASRGVGQGIAIGLGEAGATVYITGRTLDPPGQGLDKSPNCLRETARLIESGGGKAIPVAVDHSDDSQVSGLFSRIRREQSGRLDILVNSAFAASDHLMAEAGPDSVYWEQSNTTRSPYEEWDLINRVGLRNSYTCCVLATRMMVECRSDQSPSHNSSNNCSKIVGQQSGGTQDSRPQLPTGIIVNVSSLGGTKRIFNVPFCAGKSALDRMTMEMARDLRRRGIDICVISLVPGVVRTEGVVAAFESGHSSSLMKQGLDLELALAPEIPGRVVAALSAQSRKSLAKQSGRCLLVAELARQFGLRQHDRSYPRSPRSLKSLLQLAGWNRLAIFFPDFVCLPYWMIAILTSKF
ncbi:unnamed protein product [Calicophoron daubneyi]|uniref:Dehydrogenase/reductase SDR family member 1 n=1 Tax=Calicophoron daubneyi TaxID=300641 RepID=A0AAV2TWC1_CALDB